MHCESRVCHPETEPVGLECLQLPPGRIVPSPRAQVWPPGPRRVRCAAGSRWSPELCWGCWGWGAPGSQRHRFPARPRLELSAEVRGSGFPVQWCECCKMIIFSHGSSVCGRMGHPNILCKNRELQESSTVPSKCGTCLLRPSLQPNAVAWRSLMLPGAAARGP